MKRLKNNANATKLALRVHLRIASCRNLLMREARRVIERSGITLPQFDVLAELERDERGFTFGELSRLLLVTSGNLTGIVDHLEADGLAKRLRYETRDRRVVRIVLTRKGRDLVRQVSPAHARGIQAALAFMPADRLALLEELLREVSHRLQEGPTAPADARNGNGTRPHATSRRHRLREHSTRDLAFARLDRFNRPPTGRANAD